MSIRRSRSRATRILAGLISAAAAAGAAPSVLAQSDYLVADGSSGNRIIRIEAGSGAVIDHFVGAGLTGLDNPVGMAFDPVTGDLLVCSADNDRVYRYDGQTGQPSAQDPFIATGAGGLDGPVSIAFGPTGVILVASNLSDAVLAFDQAGTPLGPFVTGIATPGDLIITGDGRLLVRSGTGDSVHQYDAITGAPIGDGILVSPGSAGLQDPRGMVITPDGRLLVASVTNDRVLQYDVVTGEPVNGGTLVAAGAGGLNGPTGMILDAAGDLLVLDFPNDRILRFDADAGFFISIFSVGSFSTPVQIVARPDDVPCASDVTGDGTVDFNDILRVVADFGDCL